MSLRFRLSLYITILFTLILLVGSIYVIDNARNTVNEEVRATSKLTLQLFEVAVANQEGQNPIIASKQALEQIVSLESIRHLDMQLRLLDGRGTTIPIMHDDSSIVADAPEWFTRLTTPPPIEYQRILMVDGIPPVEILISADPADEITEAWNETRGILGLLSLFLVLANVLVFITLGRGLKPIEKILNGLGGIEQGDYRLRLPRFKLPELTRISEKFNLMAAELERSREENRLLTQRSLAIQENERRLLAHELHDELGQSITAIKAVAVSIEQQSKQSLPAVAASAGTIIDMSNYMYDVARTMMKSLRPAVLDELGLIAALQDMIDDWNERHQDVFCSFGFTGDFSGLCDEISISIYRIVQESLTNVIKHADASKVEITVRLVTGKSPENDQIELNIRDNGKGFEKDSTPWGLGLLGIRERTSALKGEIRLSSAPGQGVEMNIRVPLTSRDRLP